MEDFMKQIQLTIVLLLLSLCPLSAQQNSKTVPPATITGSGTTNYVPLWTGSTTLGNSIMYQTDSRIGINTTSPQYALDVSARVNSSAGYLIGETQALSFPGGIGYNNVAVGPNAFAGSSFTGAYADTAIGSQALYYDTSGAYNTAVGSNALYQNQSGTNNTAVGAFALESTSDGGNNTAAGYGALSYNEGGNNNVADGAFALFTATGSDNTAVGYQALASVTSGGQNTAIGYNAGGGITSGSLNIDIGNEGTSSDNGVIRIGTAGSQTSFFASGIRGVATGENNAIPVVIDSNGQLGTVSSSRRFKTDIQDMGDASNGLMRLRPVTFRYKKPFADGSQPIQYGLIAEEVAEVYPDLVARSAGGEIEAVKYQVLGSMLLNEVQRQEGKLQSEEAEIRSLQERLNEMKAAMPYGPETFPTRAVLSPTSATKEEQQRR
jgi:hypothetical protein